MSNLRLSRPSVIASLLALAMMPAIIQPDNASAITGADWRAGNIVSDSAFYDSSSMSVEEIQAFLNSKVSSCDTNGTLPATEYGRRDLTHAQYAASQGWPGPPYVCLRDYQQVPRSDAIIDNFSGSIPAGAISAAQIIKNAADSYGISPKSLIVLLHKESPGPLTLDTWPLQKQYKNAMGYACPDTAPCDPQFAGFYNQMMNAAKRLKSYRDNASSYRHKAFQTANVYYNPNLNGCGASSVYLQNHATAGLYNYTPYQPNQAALNNLWGTGDSCSAYGNRNFWRTFTTWFGGYTWEFGGQTIYTDSSKTVAVDPLKKLDANKRYYFVLKAKNNGNQSWKKETFRLGTSAPQNRASSLCTTEWLTCSRPAALKEDTVRPGETGTFEFWFIAPNFNSSIKEYFTPVVEGEYWLNDIGMHIPISTPTLSWQYGGQGLYTDSSKTNSIDYSKPLEPNKRYYVQLKAINNGEITWQKNSSNEIILGTSRDFNRYSAFCDSTWLNCSRPAKIIEDTVAPGQTGTFEFWLKTPSDNVNQISLSEYFQPLIEDKLWLNDLGMHFPLIVGTYQWQHISQSIYADSARTIPAPSYPNPTAPNLTYYVTLQTKNTGSLPWKKGEVKLGSSRELDRISALCDNSWLSCSRVGTTTQEVVNPGESGTFQFAIKAPRSTSDIKEYFRLVKEGVIWMNDPGMHIPLNLNGKYSWQWAGQTLYTDSSKSIPVNPFSQNLAPSSRYYMVMRAKNTGTYTWTQSGGIILGTSSPLNRSSPICDPTWISCGRPATIIEQSVAPSEYGTFEFWITTPSGPFNSLEYFRPLIEHVTWLEDYGAHLRVNVLAQ